MHGADASPGDADSLSMERDDESSGFLPVSSLGLLLYIRQWKNPILCPQIG